MLRPRSRLLVMAVVALVLGACEYFPAAVAWQESGGPAPWFCNPVAPNSVTGPGMGTVDWYASVPRATLTPAECNTFGANLDLTKDFAELYPTVADAEAGGFSAAFAFIPGMGTHHAFQGVTPELLADPSFDRFNPVIPDSVVDTVFEPNRPEFLQYNGNGPDSVLVGMSWYVRTTTGLPPAGFPGTNDRWHHHPQLCFNTATAVVNGVNTTDAQCTSRGGINVHMDDYYMLHTWQVDDLEYRADVFAPMHPCIMSTGAIFDMDDPCHQSALGGATPSVAVAVSSEGASTPRTMFCPLFQIEEQARANEAGQT